MVRRFLTALALITVAAVASASDQRVAWTRAALGRLPVSHRDRTPERLEARARILDTFAIEIARVSASAPLAPQQWASLIGGVGSGESNFDSEIVAGRCRRWDCDPKLEKGKVIHQSVGAFQQKRFAHVDDLWPAAAAGDIAAQVQMVDRQLRRSMSRCKPFAPFPAHVFRAYGGGSCSFPTGRESEKVAAYARMMATPAAKAGGAS